MSRVDVLIIAALQMEYDAAYKVPLGAHPDGSIANWQEYTDLVVPYVLGDFVTFSGKTLTIALARSSRMGGVSVSPVIAALMTKLSPRYLAMSGVCAGKPGDTSLGDVIIADVTYQYDEGKRKGNDFYGDHRQFAIPEAWRRAAQELSVEGLPCFGQPTDEEREIWLLSCLYQVETIDPWVHPARSRYFSHKTWKTYLESYEQLELICLDGQKLRLTDKGRQQTERHFAFNKEEPERLPFKVVVGPIASGNAVVKDEKQWSKLEKMGVRTAVGIEMEGAVIGANAHQFNMTHWVVVKGVMDHGDQHKSDHYKNFAAKASAEVLFRFLAEHTEVIQRTQPDEEQSASPKGKLNMWLKALIAELDDRKVSSEKFPELDKAFTVTFLYLSETEVPDAQIDSAVRLELSMLWKKAANEIQKADANLYDSCFQKSMYWSDPSKWDADSIEDAGFSYTPLLTQIRSLGFADAITEEKKEVEFTVEFDERSLERHIILESAKGPWISTIAPRRMSNLQISKLIQNVVNTAEIIEQIPSFQSHKISVLLAKLTYRSWRRNEFLTLSSSLLTTAVDLSEGLPAGVYKLKGEFKPSAWRKIFDSVEKEINIDFELADGSLSAVVAIVESCSASTEHLDGATDAEIDFRVVSSEHLFSQYKSSKRLVCHCCTAEQVRDAINDVMSNKGWLRLEQSQQFTMPINVLHQGESIPVTFYASVSLENSEFKNVVRIEVLERTKHKLFDEVYDLCKDIANSIHTELH